MLNLILACAGAYLIGAIPFARLLAIASGHRPEPEEDLHIYLYNRVGRAAGFGAVFFDMFVKGSLTVTAAWWTGQTPAVMMGVGLSATIGQMWPVFERFNGGKGNTTGGGMFFAMTICLNNPAMWLGIIPIVLGGGYKVVSRLARHQSALRGPVSNALPLGVIIGAVTIPLTAWLAGLGPELVIGYCILFVIITLRRLTANLAEDRRQSGSLGSMLLWRFLFDRSWLVMPVDKEPRKA
jgi:glycerol-3-phosphate acyltransferase PlsY